MSDLWDRAKRHPLNYSKRVTIDFLTKWFRQNQLFALETDGDARPGQVPLDADGRPTVRTGEPNLVIRAAFGRHDEADIRRAIVVQRGRFRSDRTTIGNQAGTIPVQYKGAVTQARRYLAREQIPITAWCLSPVEAEADAIAGFVHTAFQFWRIDVRKDYPGLRDIVDLAVGEAQLIERVSSTHEVIGVPVTLVLDIQYEWLIFQKDAEALNTIITQVEGGPECVEFGDGGEVPWPSS